MKLLPLILGASALLLQGAIAQRGGGRMNRETSPAEIWRFLAKKYDKNKNGKITWREYNRDKDKFESFDTDGDGLLSKADFKSEDEGRGRRGGGGRDRRRGGEGQTDGGGATPRIGQKAPDFELPLVKTPKKTLKLSSFAGKKPVALIFGSYTWPPFVAAAGRLRKLYKQYRKSVQFILVYVHEAHAIDGNSPRGSVKVEDPINNKERQVVAKTCVKKLKLPMSAVVDKIDDKVGKAYGGIPDRLYLVDKAGKIAFAGGRGPQGFKPDELEDAIREELNLKPIKRKKKPVEEERRGRGRR